MNLYLLKTKGLGEFYLIAKTPNDAQNKLESDLEKSDYGFYKDREVEVITLLSKKMKDFPEGKPNFSSSHKLLFAD